MSTQWPTTTPSYHRLPLSLSLLLALLWSATTGAGWIEPFTPDTPTPAFDLQDLDGNQHRLVDYRGQVLLVNFWATWCSPCVREMPGMQRLQEQMKGKPFQILAINVGQPGNKVQRFVNSLKFHLPVLLDQRSQSFETWGVNVLPTSYLLDGEGRIRYRARGPVEWDGVEATAIVEALLPGPPADTENPGERTPPGD